MIKYDIHSIQNVTGSGEERKFVHIFENEAKSEDQLCRLIEERTTLTQSDVRATLTALRSLMEEELSQGNRFALPGIGYFSLRAGNRLGEGRQVEQVRGNDIYVRNVKFRPTKALLHEVQMAAHFERSDGTTNSMQHTAETLYAAIRDYLDNHSCLTRVTLEREFHLRKSTAQKWLAQFVAEGKLRKEGARNSPVYFLNE